MNKDFVNEVIERCELELKHIGLKRPRKGTHYLESDTSFLGWLGLNQLNKPGYLQLNPFIGIHCEPLMKLYSEMQNERYKKADSATFAINIGELVPDEPKFIFSEDTDIKKTAVRLAGVIQSKGFPWIGLYQDYSSILPILEERVEQFGRYPQLVTLVHCLMGNHAEAKKFSKAKNEEYSKSDDELLKNTWGQFYTSFLEYMDVK